MKDSTGLSHFFVDLITRNSPTSPCSRERLYFTTCQNCLVAGKDCCFTKCQIYEAPTHSTVTLEMYIMKSLLLAMLLLEVMMLVLQWHGIDGQNDHVKWHKSHVELDNTDTPGTWLFVEGINQSTILQISHILNWKTTLTTSFLYLAHLLWAYHWSLLHISDN